MPGLAGAHTTHAPNSVLGHRQDCQVPVPLTHLSSRHPQTFPLMFSLPNQVWSGRVCQGGGGRSVLTWAGQARSLRRSPPTYPWYLFPTPWAGPALAEQTSIVYLPHLDRKMAVLIRGRCVSVRAGRTSETFARGQKGGTYDEAFGLSQDGA